MLRSLLGLLLTTGVAAAEPPKPAVVVQSRNFAKLFDDYGHMVAAALGEKERKAFQELFEDDLGEKGLRGLDQTRPWAGYLLATNKLDDTAFLLMVPITKEADFLDLLDRLDFTAEEVTGAAGLYEVEWPAASMLVRFHEKYAYLGVNASRAQMDPKALIPAKQLFDPDDLSPVAVTVYPDRLSKDWRTAAVETVRMIVGQELFFGPEPLPGVALLESLTRLQDNAAGLEPVRLTAGYDRERGEVAVELTAKGAKGTPLAATIAGRKPGEYRFGGIAGTAATGRFCWPALGKPARESIVDLISRSGHFATDVLIDPPYQPATEVLLDAVKSAVAKNAADFVVALDGPDKAGHYAATFALGIGDGKKLDAALRKFVGGKPNFGDNADTETVQKVVTLDAAKVGDVAIHTVKLGEFLPKEWQELLGDKAEVAVAVTTDAVFVTVGSDAVGRVKAAMAAKPAVCDPLTVTVTPKALAPLLDKLDLPNVFGDSDKPLSLLGVTLTGGESLRLRATLNLTLLDPFRKDD